MATEKCRKAGWSRAWQGDREGQGSLLCEHFLSCTPKQWPLTSLPGNGFMEDNFSKDQERALV